MRRLRPWIPLLAGASVFLAGLLGWSGIADGTPNYAARAGRACDTCHLDPSLWENPAVKERKCTMSCQSCHVDPSGGGMRNVSGRFYGAAVLPMVATQPRPTSDWDDSFLGLAHRKDTKTVYTDEFPRGPATPREQNDPEFAADDTWAWGTPVGGRGTYSYVQGRYGTLRADPVLRVGWDVRAAYLTRAAVFPMQLDLGLAFQPVEHLTAVAVVGARGRSEGVEAVFDDPKSPYLRDGYLLLHELPYQAYFKAGRFAPSYGLRLDDHTAFTRRRLGLDLSLPESRVTGVEIGANPNYPFVNASWFRSKSESEPPDAFDPFDVDDSWGMAANAGYRDLAWGAGAGVLHRDYTGDGGIRRTAYGAWMTLTPAVWWPGVPLTYQLEVDREQRDRVGGGTAAAHVLWQELGWLVANGVNVLAGHTWEDPDRDVAYDEAHRFHAGVQVTPYPGVTLDVRGRVLAPRVDPEDPLAQDDDGATGADLFFQIHLWN